MEFVFQKERKLKGHAHAKSEEGTPKSARLMIDLAMIFLHYCRIFYDSNIRTRLVNPLAD
jgi:hypothetical protein